jgi:hypothetical protein
MAYHFSILTSTGYPFYYKKILEEPEDVSLNMRFYNFVNEIIGACERSEQSFELQAGLVSALYEFAKVLGYPIELLKYKSQAEAVIENSLQPVEIPENSDVLVTARSESFLIPKHFEAKINLIYNHVIKRQLPLGPERRITDSEEKFIIEMMSDASARERISKHKAELDNVAGEIIKEYQSYGLESLLITTFDGFPIVTYNIEHEAACNLLRSLGIIPAAKEYQWNYRSASQKGFFVINSGCGPTVNDVFMPYCYILITNEGSFLGDSPTTIYQKINHILIE